MRCQPSVSKWCSHLNLWFVGVPHSFTQPFCFCFSFLQIKCKFWGCCQREARDWCIKCLLLSLNLSLFSSLSVSLLKWVPLTDEVWLFCALTLCKILKFTKGHIDGQVQRQRGVECVGSSRASRLLLNCDALYDDFCSFFHGSRQWKYTVNVCFNGRLSHDKALPRSSQEWW